MKKLISLLIILIMCFSLCACAEDPNKVLQEKLLGTWYSEDTVDSSVQWYYIFNEDGTCITGFSLAGEEIDSLKGSPVNYTIENEKIYIEGEYETTGEIVSNGSLLLSDSSGSVVFVRE